MSPPGAERPVRMGVGGGGQHRVRGEVDGVLVPGQDRRRVPAGAEDRVAPARGGQPDVPRPDLRGGAAPHGGAEHRGAVRCGPRAQVPCSPARTSSRVTSSRWRCGV